MNSSTGVDKPTRPESADSTRKGTALNVLAVLLAAIALGAAFMVPWTLGPRTLVARESHGGTAAISTSCTHYVGAEVTISVPGRGTIVVSATVGVGINHTFGVNDEARISVAASDAECGITDYTAFVSVPAPLARDSSYYETVPLLRPFAVSGAGEYTFYVNGVMAQGADANDRFDSASLVATYHPA